MYEDAIKHKRFTASELKKAGIKENQFNETKTAPNPPPDMEVMWSNRSYRWNDQYLQPETPDKHGTSCQQIDGTLPNLLYVMLDPKKSLRQNCPYIDTLSAYNARHGYANDKVRDKLKNRYIFYGGDLAAVGDTVFPPTHTRLPAIYQHAMAFDNLLSFGDKYKRQNILLNGLSIGTEAIDLFLSILVTLAVIWFVREQRRSQIYELGMKERSSLNKIPTQGQLRICWSIILTALLAVPLAILTIPEDPNEWAFALPLTLFGGMLGATLVFD